MWWCIIGCAVPSVSKDQNAVIAAATQSKQNRSSWTAWPQRLRQQNPFKSWKQRTQCHSIRTESFRAPLSEPQSSFITSEGLLLPTFVQTEKLHDENVAVQNAMHIWLQDAKDTSTTGACFSSYHAGRNVLIIMGTLWKYYKHIHCSQYSPHFWSWKIFWKINIKVFEIQTQYIIKHNTLMPQNNVLHVSVHQNHQALLLQKFKQYKYIFICKSFISKISLVHNYLLK
jgi:hypothetical protein